MEKEKTEEIKTEEVKEQLEVQPTVQQDIQQSQQQVEQQVVASKPSPKKFKFEVAIYDKVSVGDPPYDKILLEKVNFEKPVIIEAGSKKDLQDFGEKLALCQLTFKIIRKLDDPVQQLVQQPIQLQQILQQAQVALQIQQVLKVVIQQKPKYYKVGDIEIKDDNGKIYQKQWMKLSESEMSNFRIINDKTNSIFNLKDRHIEMKKWVLVDSTTEDDSTNLEENMK